GGDSGLAWAEGTLWVGEYRARKIHQIDPDTGKILRTIESRRFVTGVTWVDGELWHGVWDDGAGELPRIDAQSGNELERLEMPTGTACSGLESDGADRFYCGGGTSGKVRAVRRPKRPTPSRSYAASSRADVLTTAASSRSSRAPSPRHALPCITASVVGASRARRSS